jgi:hypothetical protein
MLDLWSLWSATAMEAKLNFKSNVGSLDRTLRVVLGVALIALVFVGPNSLFGLIGFVPLPTPDCSEPARQT